MAVDMHHRGRMPAASLSARFAPPLRVARPLRFVLRLALPLALLVSVWAAAGCGVGDQICTPESNYGDKSDDCPYGPPGGPKPPVGDCADIPQKTAAECMTPKTWSADVFPIFATTEGGTAGCGIGACHGDEVSYSRVFLPPTNAKAGYDALTKYEGSQKYPYVNSSAPEHSWILCNLEDPPGVGAVMPAPPGTLTQADIDIIREWLECGAPYDAGGM